MESSKPQKRLIPRLSPEVATRTVDGVFEIELPQAVEYKLPMNDKFIPSLQLRCQSLLVKRPNTVCCCNSVVKTIVGQGKGDQTEIIECGKCRTAYLVRTIYGDDGSLVLKTAVWNLGRNILPFGRLKQDKDYHFWIEFNKK